MMSSFAAARHLTLAFLAATAVGTGSIAANAGDEGASASATRSIDEEIARLRQQNAALRELAQLRAENAKLRSQVQDENASLPTPPARSGPQPKAAENSRPVAPKRPVAVEKPTEKPRTFTPAVAVVDGSQPLPNAVAALLADPA